MYRLARKHSEQPKKLTGISSILPAPKNTHADHNNGLF